MSSQRPVDGPATSFVPDPFVPDMVTLSTDYHGIVVVTMWPPSATLIDAYTNQLLPEVRKCFDDHDLVGTEAPVYLYPPESLHVTVASFTPIVKRTESIDHYKELNEMWRHVLQRASQQPDWPTQPLQLKYADAQIGAKAGIVLWKETTGGIAQMRACIQQQATLDGLQIRSVPNIVHSTFLRFQSVPSTPGTNVQERFATIKAKLPQIFASPLPAVYAKTVCEWSPYMHIPDDENHTLCAVRIGRTEDT